MDYETFVRTDDPRKPHFFVFDNDDTLFDHSIGTVREKTYEALEKLKKKGHILALNTSRSPEETVNIPKRLTDLMDAVILLDGAYVTIGKETKITYLDMEVMPKVIRFFEEHDVTYRYCLDTGTGYLNKKDPEKENLFYVLYDMIPETKPYEGERIIHILYYATGDLREEIISLCGDMETNRMAIAGEISPKGKNKGLAMLETGRKRTWNLISARNTITILNRFQISQEAAAMRKPSANMSWISLRNTAMTTFRMRSIMSSSTSRQHRVMKTASRSFCRRIWIWSARKTRMSNTILKKIRWISMSMKTAG